ncbi:hypothetical protein F4804DRAFT_329803 [Jackrogersella minutella]|nr:hypothetical protein F4804DRAFT_329803 [Jackrogersella minutella]
MTTTASPPADTVGVSRPCNRCKEQEGTIDLRGAEVVCKSCFAYYVSSKAIKRLEALQRETRRASGPRRPQRYLVGLSCGASSTALLHVLTENAAQQRARGQKVARVEYAAAHVVDDTSAPRASVPGGPGGTCLSAYRARFPDAELLSIPLSAALDVPAVGWGALPPPDPALPPAQRLSDVLDRLPSATSRADARRLLVRHLLVAAAAGRGCDALLLGHNTTSLAELTLAETAKGRGFSLPHLVNDGAAPVGSGPDSAGGARTLPIYSPLRELFRKELATYLSHTSPPLTPLLLPPSPRGGGGAVVSHRDLSIDDVLARYFGEVETSYPSVVANVVRTTGKLLRRGGEGQHDTCGLCGTVLDELGDERWRGEIGDDRGEEDDDGREKPRLCYGCERSVRG